MASYQAQLESASVCCDSYSDIEYQPLESTKKIKFSSKYAKAMRFGGKTSFFAAFELTDFVPSKLIIKSYIEGAWLSTSHIVYPVVLFLDENKQPLYEPKLQHRWKSDFWKGGYLLFDIPLIGTERFVIVYADVSKVRSSIRYSKYNSGIMPIYSGGSTFYVPVGAGTSEFDIPFGVGGELNIEWIKLDETKEDSD
jgi:hypothetical protein